MGVALRRSGRFALRRIGAPGSGVVRVPRTQHQCALDLPAEVASARAARRFVERFVTAHHSRVDLDALDLLVSELVANAVVHAHSPVRLRLTDAPGALLVEVSDALPADGRLAVHVAAPTAADGRGLYLVEQLARRWGVQPTLGGKTVWFELDCA